jgi:hypothetical protein
MVWYPLSANTPFVVAVAIIFVVIIGQYEGSNSRAACEGFTTQYNTVPITAVNTKVLSPRELTNAGLDRQTAPGAGAITQAYGVRSEAVDHIPAGFELTVSTLKY